MTIATPLIASGFICATVSAMVMDESTKEILLYAIPTASTIALAWIGYLTLKVKSTVAAVDTKVDAVVAEVDLVKVATNGLSDKFALASKKEGHAEGKDQERLEQKAREAERAIGSLAVKDSAGVPGPLPAKEKNGAEAKLPPDKPAPSE